MGCGRRDGGRERERERGSVTDTSLYCSLPILAHYISGRRIVPPLKHNSSITVALHILVSLRMRARLF